MATLRCPQCGAVNRDDAVEYPLCRNCHERLVQCGYCREFRREGAEGGGTCRSRRAGGPRPARADDAPDCAHFRPRYTARTPSEARVRIHPAAWILGVVAVIFVVLFALSAAVGPAPPDEAPTNPLQVSAEAPYPISPGSEFTLTVTARNVSREPTGEVRLGIPAEFLERFDLTEVTPTPSARERAEGHEWLRYPSLRSGEWLSVGLRLKAPESGEYELRARLAGAGAGAWHEIPVPIQVVAEGAPAGARGEGSP